MDEDDQAKPTPAQEDTESDPKPVADWPLTLEGDDRTEEAGYGYGV